MKRPAYLTTLLATAVLSFASAPGAFAQEFEVGAIEIGNPWSRATPPGAKTGAGYMTLTNRGADADRLVSIASPVADKVEVHNMSINDGVMTMRPVERLEVPAGGEAKLAPGGYHLMMMGIKEPFRQGETVPVTLTFEKAGPVEIELMVGTMGAKGPAQADGPAGSGEKGGANAAHAN